MHVHSPIFQGQSKEKIFSTMYPTLLMLKNIVLTKNPLNYYSLKVTKFKFHGDSVNARTKKLRGGAPPSLFMVK